MVMRGFFLAVKRRLAHFAMNSIAAHTDAAKKKFSELPRR
jgi:hypothetical protein